MNLKHLYLSLMTLKGLNTKSDSQDFFFLYPVLQFLPSENKIFKITQLHVLCLSDSFLCGPLLSDQLHICCLITAPRTYCLRTGGRLMMCQWIAPTRVAVLRSSLSYSTARTRQAVRLQTLRQPHARLGTWWLGLVCMVFDHSGFQPGLPSWAVGMFQEGRVEVERPLEAQALKSC